jgi:hypothetical protein
MHSSMEMGVAWFLFDKEWDLKEIEALQLVVNSLASKAAGGEILYCMTYDYIYTW